MTNNKQYPASYEDIIAFAARLKDNPVEALKFFQDAGILDEKGNLTLFYIESPDD